MNKNNVCLTLIQKRINTNLRHVVWAFIDYWAFIKILIIFNSIQHNTASIRYPIRMFRIGVYDFLPFPAWDIKLG